MNVIICNIIYLYIVHTTIRRRLTTEAEFTCPVPFSLRCALSPCLWRKETFCGLCNLHCHNCKGTLLSWGVIRQAGFNHINTIIPMKPWWKFLRDRDTRMMLNDRRDFARLQETGYGLWTVWWYFDARTLCVEKMRGGKRPREILITMIVSS